MEDLLQTLREFDALRDQAEEKADRVLTRSVASVPAEFAPPEFLQSLPEPVRQSLEAQGITQLYVHQAEAIRRIRNGEDVVLEAPTASGKTLCFTVPLVEAILKEPRLHAMMLHPMKALSNDQRRQFEDLAGPLARRGQAIDSWVFDGDTEAEHRKLLKDNPPALLLTNPEMLQYSFLGWSEQWENYLRNLRLIIIDEIHEYRGFFGTNVALLMRRFLTKLETLGCHPQVILATATCGNAKEHAYRLTGRDCTLVRCQTAMRPEREFAFVEPAIPDFNFHEIYRVRIVKAALACASRDLSTLIFCPSRKFAEEATIRAKQEAPERGIDPEVIVPYRSGYSPELRRDIEDGMRSGKYRVVFTTNALEIGIDIGRLDACILAGFPDSVLSAWQRIGRTGRSWKKKAYVIFYAFNNPFDRFFASNIDAFLDKPLDEILIGVDNEELMRKHLPFLLHEVDHDLDDSLSEKIGEPFLAYARAASDGVKPMGGHKPPYNRLNLRSGGGAMYKLTYKGKELGTMSDVQAFREAYVGAIYNHFGKRYRVTAQGAGELLLEDAESHLRTDGIFYTVTQGSEVLQGRRWNEALSACYGKVTVFENFAGYKVIDTRSGDIQDDVRSDQARRSQVRGFWLEVSDWSDLPGEHDPEDLFGFEQIMRVGSPFVIPCDRHDLGTLSTIKPPFTVYVYETVPGGIGVAEKALDLWPEVVRTGIRIAESCGCRDGCPSCLVPPRIPAGAIPPRKSKAIAVAHALLEFVENANIEEFDPDIHGWRQVSMR